MWLLLTKAFLDDSDYEKDLSCNPISNLNESDRIYKLIFKSPSFFPNRNRVRNLLWRLSVIPLNNSSKARSQFYTSFIKNQSKPILESHLKNSLISHFGDLSKKFNDSIIVSKNSSIPSQNKSYFASPSTSQLNKRPSLHISKDSLTNLKDSLQFPSNSTSIFRNLAQKLVPSTSPDLASANSPSSQSISSSTSTLATSPPKNTTFNLDLSISSSQDSPKIYPIPSSNFDIEAITPDTSFSQDYPPIGIYQSDGGFTKQLRMHVITHSEISNSPKLVPTTSPSTTLIDPTITINSIDTIFSSILNQENIYDNCPTIDKSNTQSYSQRSQSQTSLSFENLNNDLSCIPQAVSSFTTISPSHDPLPNLNSPTLSSNSRLDDHLTPVSLDIKNDIYLTKSSTSSSSYDSNDTLAANNSGSLNHLLTDLDISRIYSNTCSNICSTLSPCSTATAQSSSAENPIINFLNNFSINPNTNEFINPALLNTKPKLNSSFQSEQNSSLNSAISATINSHFSNFSSSPSSSSLIDPSKKNSRLKLDKSIIPPSKSSPNFQAFSNNNYPDFTSDTKRKNLPTNSSHPNKNFKSSNYSSCDLSLINSTTSTIQSLSGAILHDSNQQLISNLDQQQQQHPKNEISLDPNSINQSTPKQQPSSSQGTVCFNCSTEKTPLWRRNSEGKPLCNACGLFFKLHGINRPLSLKKNTIKKRNRHINPSTKKPKFKPQPNSSKILPLKIISPSDRNFDYINTNAAAAAAAAAAAPDFANFGYWFKQL
ncbi:Nitrogen regulatory protein NUT1 [Smittium culicis]|uniref:Nitrogen regulatory protein NUT1 n=2 Tax=Smittium culicis TaxID=133412 RepID=A0A1R1XP04_9FUNG|nr:Nitrogen regulatory protein NUT1 [Smittium culicis]